MVVELKNKCRHLYQKLTQGLTPGDHTILPASKSEWGLLIALVLIYSVIAFYHLGSTTAPETYTVIDDTTGGVEVMTEDTPSEIIVYFAANSSNKFIDFVVYGSEDGEQWVTVYDSAREEDDYHGAMTWYRHSLRTTEGMHYFIIDKPDGRDRLVLSEMGLYAETGKFCEMTPISGNAQAVIDEPGTLEFYQTRENSAYFDEIFFPASAVELQDGLSVAEMDHPPVGRLLIGVGMDLLGRNPAGFRLMQALAGVLMLPVIYLMIKALLRSVKLAILGTILLAVDFMHFTQTRIGTLDAFLVLFILLMFAFMIFYRRSENSKQRLIFLLCSGFFTGCAIGTKWSGCYAALGLAVIYFYGIYRDIHACENKTQKQKAIHRALKESLFCVCAFVILPVAIYCLSYLSYAKTLGRNDFIRVAIEHAQEMYAYHTAESTSFDHASASRWWTWPLALNPVFYYLGDEVYLYATGNPMVWGMGTIGVLFAFYRGIYYRDEAGIIIGAGYLFQMIPWFFISRMTFLYHYFPMVGFMILGLLYLFKHTCNGVTLHKVKKRYMVGFTMLAILMFVAAWPFIYGSRMTYETILDIRVSFLVLFGIALGLYLVLVVCDLISKKNSLKKIDNFEKFE